MMIPGKNKPAGTQIPYVKVVITYQIVMKVTVSPRVRLTPLERIDLIVFPSVLKRRVEIGLYSVRAHVEL